MCEGGEGLWEPRAGWGGGGRGPLRSLKQGVCVGGGERGSGEPRARWGGGALGIPGQGVGEKDSGDSRAVWGRGCLPPGPMGRGHHCSLAKGRGEERGRGEGSGIACCNWHVK